MNVAMQDLTRPRKDRLSLGSWLTAAVLTAVLLAVLSCVWLIENFARAHAERRATESLRQIALDFRGALDRGMAQQFQEVKVLSQLELFQRHDDVPAMRRALEQIRLGFGHFAWLGVTDAEGRVLAAGGGLLEGVNVAQRPWWQGGKAGPFVGDVHAAVLLEKLLPKQEEPWRFVDFALPLRDERGRYLGVFGVHLSWTWARQIRNELIDTAMESHAAEALVIGQDGTVLLGPPALEGRKLALDMGTIDTAQRYSDAGVDYFAVTAATRGQGSYPGLGWTVLMRMPTSVALADYQKLRGQIVMVALALVALSVPLAWLLARRLSAPLERLAAVISSRRHLGDEPLPRVGGYREVALLSGALADLSARQARQDAALTELNTSLEQRVEQRTAELQQALRQLQAGERRLRTIADNLPVLISYIDREQRLQFLNATFKPWMDIDPARALGQRLPELIGPEAYEPRRQALQQALDGERASFETEAEAGGVKRLLRADYIPDLLEDGSVAGVYTLATDITAAKLVEQHLDRLSRVDGLTGLPNRRQFDERLEEALARSRRNAQCLALIFLDIDKFKQINDGLGHAAGDQVLQEFARRLGRCVRSTDMVARLGGDEFVLILEGLHQPDEAELVAGKILHAMQEPVELPTGALQLATSMGIAAYAGGPDEVPAAAALLASADEALYRAKGAGRGCFRWAGGAH
ncbi:diguanylate cyclase domain-containing protein [Paucibacter sp. XJ19-41]|uniref:diguanylate cyclase domain-containing protein n=1 Tax=Paucibacter sp. XJ19-41 TaxID=2927824 RepID=UPI002348F329|nr:diguanylate cyclase [Paucibacter sp. XJ19-41]MDC6168075.1 diguanylate cyclase [Paucibacter sp. XJ19-41]